MIAPTVPQKVSPRPQADVQPGGASSDGGSPQRSDTDTNALTADERAAMSPSDYVRRCWVYDGGTSGGEQFHVQLQVDIDENGIARRAGAAGPDIALINGDPVFHAFAERAVRAVLDPQCANLPVPRDKLGHRRSLVFTFTPLAVPKDASAAVNHAGGPVESTSSDLPTLISPRPLSEAAGESGTPATSSASEPDVAAHGHGNPQSSGATSGGGSSDTADDFQHGHEYRNAWEAWYGGLPDGDYKNGAFYWTGQRSQPHSGSCYGAVSQEFTAGCIEAKRRLDPADRMRHTSLAFKQGWNSR